MTDRIKATFDQLTSKGRTALIPYVTAGFPKSDTTVQLMHAMTDAGADILELGVPFSDPMADGPVIQQSNDVALANNITSAAVLEMVREFRRDDGRTPVVLMGYANPVEAMGVQAYIEAARGAGVDGLLSSIFECFTIEIQRVLQMPLSNAACRQSSWWHRHRLKNALRRSPVPAAAMFTTYR